jgi:hypothetical protein
MAPALNDPVSATATNPPLCGVCPNPATLTSTGCTNMQYCSTSCQQRDATQHNTLCSTFQNFQQRPTPNHYRSIYFPVNESQPRFIWLFFNGSRGPQNVNDADLAQYVSGSRYGGITVTDHHDITPPRELKNMLIMQHDQNMYANNQPHSQSLQTMMGTLAARWRGAWS